MTMARRSSFDRMMRNPDKRPAERTDCCLAASTNAGLWVDRYLYKIDGGEEKQPHILNGSETIRADPSYRLAYERWKLATQNRADSAVAVVQREFRVNGRLIVGLGNKGALEVGLTFLKPWGVPIIPGSALKGIAARAARELVADQRWTGDGSPKNFGEDYLALFGDTEEAGAVCFLDAWWVPPPDDAPDSDKRLFDLDVMTTHHQDYYGGTTGAAPTDMDDPVPNNFATVKGHFLLALEGPAPWCAVALELLELGLRELGVGAKTRVGYGRLIETSEAVWRPEGIAIQAAARWQSAPDPVATKPAATSPTASEAPTAIRPRDRTLTPTTPIRAAAQPQITPENLEHLLSRAREIIMENAQQQVSLLLMDAVPLQAEVAEVVVNTLGREWLEKKYTSGKKVPSWHNRLRGAMNLQGDASWLE